jgi:YHS domain-containing protein
MAKDPVCNMMVDEKTAKFKSDYQGNTYYFCAASCKTTFDKNPAKYVKGSHGGGGGCCCCGGH